MMSDSQLDRKNNVRYELETERNGDYIISIDLLRPSHLGAETIGSRTKSSSHSKVLAPAVRVADQFSRLIFNQQQKYVVAQQRCSSPASQTQLRPSYKLPSLGPSSLMTSPQNNGIDPCSSPS